MYQHFIPFDCLIVSCCMVIWFFRSSVDGHLGCFHFLAVMNNAAMSIHVHGFAWRYIYNFNIPRTGSFGSYGKSIFNFLRNCRTVFQLAAQFYIPTILVMLFEIKWHTVKSKFIGTSLVAQWLRIHLPMQGTRVWALVQGDPTCHGVTKPVRHSYWACALEPVSHNYWARTPRAYAPQQEKPLQWEAHAPQRRVASGRRN